MVIESVGVKNKAKSVGRGFDLLRGNLDCLGESFGERVGEKFKIGGRRPGSIIVRVKWWETGIALATFKLDHIRRTFVVGKIMKHFIEFEVCSKFDSICSRVIPSDIASGTILEAKENTFDGISMKFALFTTTGRAGWFDPYAAPESC